MIACLHIPHFAARVLCRANPALRNQPLMLVHYPKGRGRVVATCPQAGHAGVEIGMSLSRARALCPEARIELLAFSQISRALETLLQELTDYSQWIDAERPCLQTACIFIDLGKLRASEGELLARTIQARLLEAHGLTATIGLAANRFTAQAAARHSPAITLVRPGEEAAFLALLPVESVPLEADIYRRLALFGLYHLGQVAALPRAALLAQFGKEGIRLHRLASGEDARRIARYQPPVIEQVEQLLEPPLADRLIVEQLLSALAISLANRLTGQGQTCREITLRLRLDDRSERESQMRLSTPQHTAAPVARSLKTLLARVTLTAPVTSVEVLVGRLEVIQPRQLSLFEAEVERDPRPALVALADRWEGVRFYTAALTPIYMLPELTIHLQPLEAA